MIELDRKFTYSFYDDKKILKQVYKYLLFHDKGWLCFSFDYFYLNFSYNYLVFSGGEWVFTHTLSNYTHLPVISLDTFGVNNIKFKNKKVLII